MTQQGVAGGAPTQTRTFLYDGLGRLTSATNPESGTICYTDSDGGNLLTWTDGRGTVSTTYDQAGRPLTRSYSAGVATGTVTYVWDTVKVGSLTPVGNADSTTTYAYYPMGLVMQTTQATKAPNSQQEEKTTTTVVGYGYNRAGGLSAMTYPSGRKVTYAADRAGHVSGMSGLKGATATTYGAQLEYSEHGALKAAQWGTGLAEAWSFNTRLQPCQIQMTNGQSQAVLAGIELYYGDEASACGASTAMTNNGNVLKQKIQPLGVMQSFVYDAWNRLNHVDESASGVEQWRQDCVCDRWGNRAVKSTTSTEPVTNVTPKVGDGSGATFWPIQPGPMGQFRHNQPSFWYPTLKNAEGSCTLGCATTFSEQAVGIALGLSFNWDKNDNLTGATVSWTHDPAVSFIGSNPPATTTSLSMMPGGLNPGQQALRVDVNSNALKSLSLQHLQTLAKAAGNVPVAAVRQALKQAISQEQKRRADEQKKLERKNCQSGQGGCPGSN